MQNVSVSVNSNKAVETKWTVLMALHQEPPAPKTIITCRLPSSDFPLRIFLKFTPDTSAHLTGLQAQCCSVCYEMKCIIEAPATQSDSFWKWVTSSHYQLSDFPSAHKVTSAVKNKKTLLTINYYPNILFFPINIAIYYSFVDQPLLLTLMTSFCLYRNWI